MKKLIKFIIILALLTQNAGLSYALRPLATRSGATTISLLAATKDSMGSTSYLIDFNLREEWKQPVYTTGNSVPTRFVEFFIGDELVARSNLTLYDGIAEIYLCRGQFLVTPQYRGRAIGREIAARTFLKAKELASSLNIELKCAIAYFEWSIDDELRWEGQQGRIMEHAARVFEGLGFRKSLADDTLTSLPGRKNFGGYWARDFDDFCGECEEKLAAKSSSAGEAMYKRFASIAGTKLDYRLAPSNPTFPSTITGDEIGRIERGITRFYTVEYARDESFHQFWWDRIRDTLYYYAYTTTGAYTTDLSGKDIIFSNNFVGCNALIFRGKKGNKPVTGLLHFMAANLTNGTIFDCLQKEGIVEPVFVVTFMPTTMGFISLDRMSQQALILYPDARLYAFPRQPIRDLDVVVSSEGFGMFEARKDNREIMPGRAFLWNDIEGIGRKQAYLGCRMFLEYRGDLPVLFEDEKTKFSGNPKAVLRAINSAA